MDTLTIDSMRLLVPGLSSEQGQRLALEVGRELSQSQQQLAPRELSWVSVNVRPGVSGDLTELARQIAGEILRELQRLP